MKKILGVLSIFLGLEFLICAVSCFFVSVPSVVQTSAVGFRILSGIELFIKYFPAVAITGYVVSLSVYFGHNEEGSFSRFSPHMMKMFRLVMITTIIITSILTLNTEVFGSFIIREKENIINQPKIINEYVKVGNNLFDNGYYDRAMRYADAALELNQNCPAALELKDKSDVEINKVRHSSDIRNKLYNAVEEAEKVERVHIDSEKISEVYQYYLRATEEFKKENWIDAHYYAELGIKLATAKDPNIEKLRQISTDSWNNLSHMYKMDKTEEQKIFDKKYEGYLALLEHDDLKAYYIFRELYQTSRELQSDPDVLFYMEIAENRINQKSFFIDETLELESFESANNVYFSYEYPDGSVDVFYCKGITIVEETGKSIQYLRDLTIISLDKNGSLFRTMTVPYAKVFPVAVEKLGESTKDYIGIDNNIETLPYFILRSVSRDRKNSEIYPLYTYSNGETASTPDYMLFPIDYDDFIMLESSTHSPENIPLFTLYKLAFNASNYGYSTEVFAQVLMNRIYFPLILIILFVLLAAFAWHNRIESGDYFKLTWAFAFPLFFIVSLYLYKLFLFIFKLFNYVILVKLSVGPALLIGAVVYLIIFIISSLCFLSSRAGK